MTRKLSVTATREALPRILHGVVELPSTRSMSLSVNRVPEYRSYAAPKARAGFRPLLQRLSMTSKVPEMAIAAAMSSKECQPTR
jgi:hypothetical protein